MRSAQGAFEVEKRGESGDVIVMNYEGFVSVEVPM